MKTIETLHVTVESKSINVEIRKLQELSLSKKKDHDKTKKSIKFYDRFNSKRTLV